MRIGFVTDELADDVRDAIETGLAWGIKDYELRVIAGKRVPEVDPATLDWLTEQKSKHRLRFTAISPGIFKGQIIDTKLLEYELDEVLPTSLRLARRLDCKMLIVFGFKKAADEPPENRRHVMDAFRWAAKEAALLGVTVAIENEPGFWCDTGKNTAAILSEIDIATLRANWDPANSVGTDELPYPDGYKHIRPWIANMHVKDTTAGVLVKCVPVGEGQIDWPGQLRAVQQDGTLTHVTIETHCLPLQEKSALNLQRVRQILQTAAAF